MHLQGSTVFVLSVYRGKKMFFDTIINKVANLLIDVTRNRLLNKNTPKGIMLLIAGGYSFNFLTERQVNVLISLLSNISISWLDIYLLIFNIFVIFLIVMGAWLIFAKVKKISKN